MKNYFTCPACGYYSFSEEPGSYEICNVCSWEDDLFQLRFPFQGGGANKESLFEHQNNINLNQAYLNKYDKDLKWRKINLEKDIFDDINNTQNISSTYPKKLIELYYWIN